MSTRVGGAGRITKPMASAPTAVSPNMRRARCSDLPAGLSALSPWSFDTSRPLREAGARGQGDVIGNEVRDDGCERHTGCDLAAAGGRGRFEIARGEAQAPSTA